MNKFVHRILKSSTASSVTNKPHRALAPPASSIQNLLDEVQHAKLIYFGEFHSESRIISFQTELVKRWSDRLARAPAVEGAGKPRLHLIMEHFSADMQPLLDAFQRKGGRDGDGEGAESDREALERLIRSYERDYGTEGHDLVPYSELLLFCRRSAASNDPGSDPERGRCEVLLHGGFVPRDHAARLNKECPDDESKRAFFEEMSSGRGYLPKRGEAMHDALFQTGSDVKLRGPSEHKLLIRSLMTGMDLYSPVDDADGNEQESNDANDGEETPFDRLYQAQLLKDHAMGYKIANIMLDQPPSDRFLVIAGFGHLKHRLGVPDCVRQYLRQAALFDADEARRATALDLLLNVSNPPAAAKSRSGNGAASIGCQMMYEAYLEDHHPLLAEAIRKAAEGDGGADAEDVKRKMTKALYLAHPETLDECILKSDEVAGPFLNYGGGVGGFEHPCADYLFVYDEDDDNVITDSDIRQMAVDSNGAKCPFRSDTSNVEAKRETLDAYNNVGNTAGIKGDAARARAIMSRLGYSEEDLSYIGDGDIYNFQGVANPHSVAKIQTGERVIDIGSGLGIDSFLAMRDCGADKVGSDSGSFVVGVDLAPSEVQHATKRASERGYAVPDRLRFIHGDVETLQTVLAKNNVPGEGTFDVCISNGAFCLVPDKKKAFENVFKALRPGGRCAISTTTIVSDHLDPSFEWPVCMRMFAPLESLQPMLEEIGFTNVQIIDAESPMEGMELPEEEPVEAGENKRFEIHGKYVDQFAFLEKMDMDELCKVVTVYGEKK